MEQRELKFRSAHYNHDGTFSGFTYWGMIDLMGRKSEDSFAGPTMRSGTTRKKEDQYIGTKDANKKEIYEGDIIKCGDQHCVVVFGKKRLGFGYHFNYKTNWNTVDKFYSINGKDKVIGNIHENPELIK